MSTDAHRRRRSIGEGEEAMDLEIGDDGKGLAGDDAEA